MHGEIHRVTKSIIFQFLIHLPIAIIVSYLYFGRLAEDIVFAVTTTVVTLVMFYFYDWAWAYKTDPVKQKYSIMAFIAIVIAILAPLIYCIVSYTKDKKIEKEQSEEQTK